MATATRRMRKIINEPDQVVKESLAGLAASVPDVLRYDVANQILVRADAPIKGKVALISGGGSGHEPLHGGFVGVGMLDAACPGEVFTSPVPDQMLAATKAVDGGAGVIHIVKNYTGDVLNFKMAADEAADDGIKVEAIVIDDDVAVQELAVHCRPAWCWGDGPRREDRGRCGGARRLARGRGERHTSGQRARTLLRDRTVVVRSSRIGKADLRPPRGRDGSGHRHSR